MNCTFCDKNISDIKIAVTISIEAERKRSDDTWENIPNMGIKTGEVLCNKCFSLFTDTLNQSMKELKNKEE